MSLIEFLFLVVVSLFVIINPLSAVPAFLAITPHDTPEERIKMAQLACVVAGIILFAFALSGKYIFTIMGITLPAFQIAGGVILFTIALNMIRAPNVEARLTPEEKEVAAEKEDVAITPLAVPLLCGPGAISTIVLLESQAETFYHNLILYLSIPFIYGIAYGILRVSAHGARWLNPIFLRVMRRLMGVLFSAVAAQFIISGIQSVFFGSEPILDLNGSPLFGRR